MINFVGRSKSQRFATAMVCLGGILGCLAVAYHMRSDVRGVDRDIYVLSNSISSGFCFNDEPWPKILQQKLGATIRVSNLSVEKASTSDLSHWQLPLEKVGSIVVAWEASNDLIQTMDANVAFERYARWCSQLRKQGFLVVAGTVIARRPEGKEREFESLRLELNERLRLKWKEFADAFADPAILPGLKTVDFPKPAVYFQDNHHPTNEAAAALARSFEKPIRTLLRSRSVLQ